MRIFYYILYLVILHVSFFCTFPAPTQAKYSGLQTKQLSVLQRKKRAATADQSRLWQNATIPYEFDKGLPKNLKNLLQNAIHHWENKTCIDFVPKLKHHKDYVVFTTESCGCCSSVGKIGGRQTLSLSSYCASESVAIHELGHVVGFWHEHTRPDRDSYITVLWNNIYKDLHKNFFKRNSFEVNSFGRPYDFASIMHYGPRTFSNGKGDTMVAINGEKMSHQSASLSTEDIIQTQLLYQCPEPECEFLISASTRGRITSPYYPSHYTANVDCQWTVVVPEGVFITLQFEEFILQDSYKCTADFLEIREFNETGLLIGQFCGVGRIPPIESLNTLWLNFHSNWVLEKSGFVIQYYLRDVTAVDTLKLNSDRKQSTTFSESGCVNVATGGHGTYQSVRIPTGKILSPVPCSFVLDGTQSTKSQMKLHMTTKQSGAYGKSCMGRIFTLIPDSNRSKGHVGIFETDSEYLLNPKRWEQVPYICLGTSRVIELLLNSTLTLVLWSSNEHKALSLEYWIDYDECADSPCHHTCINTVEGYQCLCHNGYQLIEELCVEKTVEVADYCHQELTAGAGKIISSSEPFNLCSYRVVQADQKITLTITKLIMPFPGNCSLNYLEIKSNKNLLDRLCDNVNGYEVAAGSSITIFQYTNTTLLSRLPFFIAEYYSTLKQTEACQYNLLGSGEISTLGYPTPYKPHSHCIWKLSTSKGKVIVLDFVDVDIEFTDGCKFDRLEIYDGRNKRARLLQTFCGDQSNHGTVISSGHRMTLRFITDGTGAGRGFNVTFSSMIS